MQTTMMILAAAAAVVAGFFIWQATATPGVNHAAVSNEETPLPEIMSVSFPKRINADGNPVLGQVHFRATGSRIVHAKFDIVEAGFFLPFEFDPQVTTTEDGGFTFYLNTLVSQDITMRLTLTDEQGRQSQPYEFSFTAFEAQTSGSLP